MLYDVEKISELTHISKVTIYKKFKLNDIKQYLVRKQGKSYVDEIGFNLIKQSLNLNNELNDEEIASDEIPITIGTEDILKVKNDLIYSLTEQTEFLKQQLQGKDLQITELHKLLENSQVLLKDKPKENILELEAHFQDLDTKLEEVKVNMLHRKEKQIHTKGFLSNLFNKK